VDASERERLLQAQHCTNASLRRASRALSAFYNRVLEPSGLHGNQFSLLAPIALIPDLTIKQLAALVDLDRTTLARDLKLLKERGLIDLEPGQDQRTRVVTLTPTGQTALNTALPLWEHAQQSVAEALDVATLMTTLKTLETL